jgi:ABC-type spermidine/putrescine transport system permease subunit I
VRSRDTAPINLMYTEPAVILGIIVINLPFTVLTLQSVFEGIGPPLEEAASSLGVVPSRAFWRIVFPLALPGVMIVGGLVRGVDRASRLPGAGSDRPHHPCAPR